MYMTRNHIAKPCWEGKRALRDQGMVTDKEPFTPVKECGLYLEGNGEPLKGCMRRGDSNRLAF